MVTTQLSETGPVRGHLPPDLPGAGAAPPAPASQATAIEQTRAVAEVQAAVVVAQQRPRSIHTATAELEVSCNQMTLAERAFYRYPRSGQTVTGPTIHLARELARVWGNITYGIHELRRDDDQRVSEMMAWAWDLQTNTRNSNTFIVPHLRDTKDGRKPLVDLRDVYENNTNQGARRVREAIFAVLPPWLIEMAKDQCAQTLRDGGGVPLAKRIADARRWFEKKGITLDQLEQKLGRDAEAWTEHDAAQLSLIMGALHRGEVTLQEEFPPARVTADEITAQQPPAGQADPPPAPDVDEQPGPATEDWPDVAEPGTGGTQQ
ncbi:MAG: hypothetical protein ACRDT2_10155 [Natronosporangium sp.]